MNWSTLHTPDNTIQRLLSPSLRLRFGFYWPLCAFINYIYLRYVTLLTYSSSSDSPIRGLRQCVKGRLHIRRARCAGQNAFSVSLAQRSNAQQMCERPLSLVYTLRLRAMPCGWGDNRRRVVALASWYSDSRVLRLSEAGPHARALAHIAWLSAHAPAVTSISTRRALMHGPVIRYS